MSEQDGVGRVRAATGMLVVVSIMVAFLYELTRTGKIQPWLVLLVSVLGLGAGAALLGAKAIRTGYAVFRGGGKQ